MDSIPVMCPASPLHCNSYCDQDRFPQCGAPAPERNDVTHRIRVNRLLSYAKIDISHMDLRSGGDQRCLMHSINAIL